MHLVFRKIECHLRKREIDVEIFLSKRGNSGLPHNTERDGHSNLNRPNWPFLYFSDHRERRERDFLDFPI